jgi:hypothetical protein
MTDGVRHRAVVRIGDIRPFLRCRPGEAARNSLRKADSFPDSTGGFVPVDQRGVLVSMMLADIRGVSPKGGRALSRCIVDRLP